MILLRLFWEFFKTGLFAVGGGMATIPFLMELSERSGWFTQAMLADMIAVAASVFSAVLQLGNGTLSSLPRAVSI